SLAGDLLARIQARTALVAVVGLGQRGLSLAETLAGSGYPVLGFDPNPERVRSLKTGRSYLGHVAPERVARLVSTGRLEPTADPGRLWEADVVVLCVPTPLTEAREPDLSQVVATAEGIGRYLRPG